MTNTARLSTLVLLLVAVGTDTVLAQAGPEKSAQQLVTEFQRGFGTGPGPMMALASVLLHPDKHPPGLAIDVADELQELVKKGEGSSEMLIAAVTLIGTARASHGEGALPGTVDRLESIYFDSDRYRVRSQVLYVSINVPDRPATAAFLSRAAQADDKMAFTAVTMLEALGSDGLSALRRLYESPEPSRPAVRDYLKVRAAENFAGRSPVER
jgi:hypothetical protein